MTPRILEYDNGRVKMTAQAFAIPEIKALIDKYDDVNAEAYLTYVHAMSSPESPYSNIPDDEKVDAIVFDITATLGEFDFDDVLLKRAVEKFKELYMTKTYALAEELGNELIRFRNILKNEALTMGPEGNFKDRMSLMEKIEKISTNYLKVKKDAELELNQSKTKGDHEVGEY